MEQLGRYFVIGVTSGLIYALLAVGIVLVYRGSRVLNFAQGEIGTLALYVSWAITVQQPLPWVSTLPPTEKWLVGAVAAVIVAGLVGYVFERLVVRPMADSSRLSVAVATIGLLTFLVIFESILWTPNGRILPPPVAGLGVRVLNYYVSPTQMIAVVVVVLVAAALTALFRFTDFGLGVQAAAEDQATARLMGVRAGRVSAFTWTAAAVIAAIAALLIEPTIGVFAPGYISRLFVFALAASLVGGLTSLPGAFVGGIVVGVLDSLLVYVLRSTSVGDFVGTRSIPGVDTLVIFAIILGVLLLRPNGILAARRVRVA